MHYRLESRSHVVLLTVISGFMEDREIQSLRQAVRHLLASGSRGIVVDLEVVTHLTSMVVGCFVEFYTSITRAGGSIVLAHCSAHTKKLLQVLKLDRVFEFNDSVADAISLLETRGMASPVLPVVPSDPAPAPKEKSATSDPANARGNFGRI